MEYLHTENINSYIPDNQFRSRDPKFDQQKQKYKRPSRAKPGSITIIPSSEFNFDPINFTVTCPAGNTLHSEHIMKDKQGNDKVFFRGRVSHCRDCELKTKCMRNPQAADQINGRGRQVSFILNKTGTPYTDWMKIRVDSQKGKQIYSHRMSVVEPVFGNVTSNKGLKRFSLRGKTKVNTQWKLFCLIQNIEKLANYGTLAA